MCKKLLFLLMCGVFMSMPCVLRAEDEGHVIELTVVGNQSSGLEGYGELPMDEPGDGGTNPTNPNSFHALINGNNLSITKCNEQIPSARAIVTRVANGSIVLNQQFTESLSEQIANSGAYVLRIQTDNGALVGQFMVP